MSQYTTQTQCARATRRAIRECRARASARVYTGVRTLSLRKGFKGLVDFYFYLSDNGYVVRIFISFFVHNHYLHLHFPLIKLYIFLGLIWMILLYFTCLYAYFIVIYIYMLSRIVLTQQVEKELDVKKFSFILVIFIRFT